jgi:hypothetical protein
MEVVSDGLGGYNLQVTWTIEDFDTTIATYQAASNTAIVFDFYLVFLNTATALAVNQEVARLGFNKLG